MKVLMVGPDRSVHGGISGVVNNYFEAGLDQKIDLCYIGTMEEGSKLKKLFKAIKGYGLFLVKLPRYEIVHVNVAADASFYRKYFFIVTAHLAGKKLVIHQHGGDFESFYYKNGNEKRRKMVQKAFGMADEFLVLAPIWKEFFGKIIEKNKITVLPNAVLLAPLKEKQYGQQKILFLGRLCKDKGIRELFGCISRLKEDFPRLCLYLGGIWEEEELKEEAQRYKEYIKWLGWITGEEKQKLLEECDIFVLPSHFEGQPVSVLEAMSASCGIVATKVGGIPMMITGDECGILVPPKDETSLEEGLKRVLSDPELCEKLGKCARKRAEKEFSLEENVKRLLAIYERM